MRKVKTGILAILTLLLSLPLSAALVNRYNFNPVPGDPNVVDLVGNKDGKLLGAATQSNGVLVLPGASTDGVSLPADTLSDYTSVTVEAWYTLNVNTGWFRLFDFGDTDSNKAGGYYFMCAPSASNQGNSLVLATKGFPGYSTGEDIARSPGVVPPLNKRVHTACVYDLANKQILLYQNGELVGSKATEMLLSDVHRAYAFIGSSCYTDDPHMNGTIDEFRIYNNAVSAVQIALDSQLDPNSFKACALTTMSPENNAQLVPVPAPLAWTSDPSITVGSYKVYLTTDPNLLDPNAVAVPSDTLKKYDGIDTSTSVAVAYSTVYYWRVDTIAADSTRYVGPRFKFKSAPSTPVFTVNPGTTGAFVGGSGSLTATATSEAGYTGPIQWFKVGTPDTEITTGISETTEGTFKTSTLSLSNIALTDEGLYYAKATNNRGSTSSSNGFVVVKRLLAQYLFDDNTNDNTASGLHGTNKAPSGALLTAAYLDGAVPTMGKSLTFNGNGNSVATNTTGNYVDLPDGFSNFSQGITISAWVYPTSTAAWSRMVELGNGVNGANNSIYFCRVNNGTTVRLEIDNTNPGNTGSITSGNDGIVVNQWQLLVATITDAATNNAAIYRNGVRIASGTLNRPNTVTRTNGFIGRSEWDGDALYKGQMDDVRIYNHGMTANEVAEMYYQVKGAFCQNKPAYDYNNDCKVNLTDFATFAATWMQCGLYPVAGNCN